MIGRLIPAARICFVAVAPPGVEGDRPAAGAPVRDLLGGRRRAGGHQHQGAHPLRLDVAQSGVGGLDEHDLARLELLDPLAGQQDRHRTLLALGVDGEVDLVLHGCS